ncbi:hypothetical protein AJ80_00345 [Polytolypa hystricis UAMH7299]|uniref:ENTH domain-containing protein n=1 Tax=Polytolypa hystricis (strain UAMH7299) TaxID=1447883 RepID=A0A2B7Z4N8_POLH7|nr:hypothetical protein AJ80_00345 [Polytolypa hystricis UAMH7299]
MAGSSFEKSVKGATKPKNAAPKSKYIEHLLTATYSDAGVAEIFRTLQNRLRDSTWTIVFKALIVVHMMIREGSSGAALGYLAQNSRTVAVTSISDVQVQGANIWRYAEYLIARSQAYAETKTDYVRGGQGRLKRLTVAKGLLRETEIVQKQIHTLLKCDLLSDEPENEITLTAFRLLTLDLLTLYSVMNEGTINVLEHYFEMSRPDSERALKIYKRFSAQTEDVVQFLRVARQYENATRLEIPNLKHASTDLAKLLEDDLNDPDFELRRKEYRAQKNGGPVEKSEKKETRSASQPQQSSSQPVTSNAPTAQVAPKVQFNSPAPAPDLIDFFGSIEQNQQAIAQQPAPQQFNPQNNQFQQFQQQPVFQQQQTGFAPQQIGFPQPQQPLPTGFGLQQQQQQPPFGSQFPPPNSNPFGQVQSQQQLQLPQLQPLQADHTGAGFGGYTPRPQSAHGYQSTLTSIPQNGVASFQQPMHTGGGRANNPFRQSMLPPPDNTSSPTSTLNPTLSPLTRQSTNPFSKRLSQAPQFANTTPFQPSPPMPQQHQLPERPQTQPAPLQPQQTGTNPFARNNQLQIPSPPAPLQPTSTGSTNPFRQSMLINQQTGQGWQLGQGTMHGFDHVETVPIFPRPGQPA